MRPRRSVWLGGCPAGEAWSARVSPRPPGYRWRSSLAIGTCLLLSGTLFGYWLRGEPQAPRPTAEPAVSPPTPAELPTPSPTIRRHQDSSWTRPTSLFPVALAIPDIDVATPLVNLGLMPDRTVEVPADADQAGWFHYGPAPGRRGSSVILGHVDSEQGPGVFARLHELRPGDRLRVTRADGSVVRFIVRKTELYPIADFPARRVYGRQGVPRLNLVTCAGAYDADRGGYQSNLVVYTRRAKEPWRVDGPAQPARANGRSRT